MFTLKASCYTAQVVWSLPFISKDVASLSHSVEVEDVAGNTNRLRQI